MVDRVKELNFLTNVVKACTELNNMVVERAEEIKGEIKEFEDSMDYTQQILTDEEMKTNLSANKAAEEKNWGKIRT
jgi:deoxyhypusine synthase